MKKVYQHPQVVVQEFAPNEYVAACYHGKCNITGYVFNDTNGNGQYDPRIDKYNYKNTACNHDYWIQGQSSTLPPKNAFVFEKREYIRGHYDFENRQWVEGHYEGVGDPTPVWNFDQEHTTTTMDLQNRPNHS